MCSSSTKFTVLGIPAGISQLVIRAEVASAGALRAAQAHPPPANTVTCHEHGVRHAGAMAFGYALEPIIIYAPLAFIIFFALIAEVGPSRTTFITYINPAVAVILGVIVLSEPITLGIVIGFPLVLIGSWMATRKGPAIESEPHA